MNLPLNIDIGQILLHMLNFVLLFGGLYFILYSPVKKFIDKRTEEYEKIDSEAETQKKQAEAVKAEYEAKLAGAEAEIKEMKADAEANLSAQIAAEKEKAAKEAENIVKKAKLEAEKEHEDLIRNASREISALASDAAGKIVFASDSDAVNSFFESAKESAGKSDE